MSSAEEDARDGIGGVAAKGGGLARWWAPLLLGLLAAAVRALPFRRVFHSDAVNLHGYDSFYHLRRIQFSVDHFPASLNFDPFINFPHGARPIWPPTFDWVAALLLRPISGVGQPEAVLCLAVWLPPLLGAATVVVLYWLALRYFDQTVALLAAAALAVMPAHFWYSQLGLVDHHVLVALITTFMLGAAMEAVGSIDKSSPRVALWLGFSIGFSLLTWPGSLIHVAVIQLALIARVLSAGDRDAAVAWARRFALAHLVAFVGVLPLCVGNGWERWGSLSPVVLSNFQPVYLFAGAFTFAAVAEIWRRNGLFAERRLRWLSALAVGGFLLLGALVLVPSLRVGLVDAWTWFSKDEVFQSVVAESVPLLGGSAGLDWEFPESMFGMSIYLLPIAFVYLAWKSRGRADRALFLWWAAALCFSTLNQRRFMNSYSVAHALLCAWFLRELFDHAQLRLTARPRVLRALLVSGLGIFVLSFSPALGRYSEHWESLRLGFQGKTPVLSGMARQIELVAGTARWLNEYSPEPEGEGYSVMGPWGDGHILNYVANRPVVQDNFGDDIAEENFALAEEYFSAESEALALDLLETTRSRYVLVRATGSGHATRKYTRESLFARLYGLRGSYGHFKTGGSDSEAGPPLLEVMHLENHRLIYESLPLRPGGKRGDSFCKLFEVVRGAVVSGNAESGDTVSIKMRMRRGLAETWISEREHLPMNRVAIIFAFPIRMSSSAPI